MEGVVQLFLTNTPYKDVDAWVRLIQRSSEHEAHRGADPRYSRTERVRVQSTAAFASPHQADHADAAPASAIARTYDLPGACVRCGAARRGIRPGWHVCNYVVIIIISSHRGVAHASEPAS